MENEKTPTWEELLKRFDLLWDMIHVSEEKKLEKSKLNITFPWVD
jgi:hypothetical protein